MRTRAEAKEAAARLKKHLRGEGWTTRIWENLGWHYSAHNGTLSVYPSANGKFHCLLSDGTYFGTGECYWLSRFHSQNPNKAVQKQLAIARAFVRKLKSVLTAIENNLAGKSATLKRRKPCRNRSKPGGARCSHS